jgi:hypothetical protein
MSNQIEAVRRVNLARESYKAMAGKQTGAKTEAGRTTAAHRNKPKHGCKTLGAKALSRWIRSAQGLARSVLTSSTEANIPKIAAD